MPTYYCSIKFSPNYVSVIRIKYTTKIQRQTSISDVPQPILPKNNYKIIQYLKTFRSLTKLYVSLYKGLRKVPRECNSITPFTKYAQYVSRLRGTKTFQDKNLFIYPKKKIYKYLLYLINRKLTSASSQTHSDDPSDEAAPRDTAER